MNTNAHEGNVSDRAQSLRAAAGMVEDVGLSSDASAVALLLRPGTGRGPQQFLI